VCDVPSPTPTPTPIASTATNFCQIQTDYKSPTKVIKDGITCDAKKKTYETTFGITDWTNLPAGKCQAKFNGNTVDGQLAVQESDLTLTDAAIDRVAHSHPTQHSCFLGSSAVLRQWQERVRRTISSADSANANNHANTKNNANTKSHANTCDDCDNPHHSSNCLSGRCVFGCL